MKDSSSKEPVDTLDKKIDDLSAQVSQLQQSVDLLYQDHNTVIDLTARVIAMEARLKMHDTHIDLSIKDVKEDIMRKDQNTTEAIDKVKETIAEGLGQVAQEVKKTIELPKQPINWKRRILEIFHLRREVKK